MKPRSIQAEYDAMKQEADLPWCWACGRGEIHRPQSWFAPWFIHRAHIVNKPRVDDRRVVVLLCAACHGSSAHGEKIAGWTLPRLTLANLLWLKRKRDPEYYSRRFLQRHSVRILPRVAKPPGIFLTEYAARRGQ